MKTPNNLEDYRSNYSENGLWDKIAKTAQFVGIKAVYAALLLYYVLQDPSVSLKHKAIIYGALGYFILPIDLIPDYIPVVGFTDDISALLYAVHSVWASVTPEMNDRAKARLHQWFGAYDEDKINLS
jgi:uncharacterized membrane protein YkvA (DUF1232 family)